ncbi:MAG: SpoIIE family protein phosphatase [Planctomycetota bacterium]
MAELRTVEGPHTGGVFALDRELAVLGRLPDCDIVLDSGSVSREHARIERVDNKFYIKDLDSRNGTYINGSQIHERCLLNDQDRITLCDVVMVFSDDTVNLQAVSSRKTASLLETTAMMVDDEPSEGNSTVMTRLDISSGSSNLRLEVNSHAKLKAMTEISRNLGRAVAMSDVLPKVLDSLLTIFPQADRGIMVLRDTASGKLIPKVLKHRRPELVDTVRISRTIVQGVMAGKEAILSADATSDSRFNASESIVDFHIRSVMCAPLITSQGNVTGVIQIDTSDQRNRFTRDDLEVLASVACQAANAVENAELHEMAIRDQKRSRELEVAHAVLRGFLPSNTPRIEGYDFFHFYEPANELGGDYYDYIPLPGRRLAVVVADVSGKGIPASLLMARLSADVRYCLVSEPSPAEAIAQLNRVFFSANWEDRFVTLVLAVLDPLRHELTLVNAGHPPSYLRHAGKVIQAVDEANARLPLGVMENAEYVQVSHSLDPGDRLVLYTDGISEAMNEKNELYGLRRLHEQTTVSCPGVAAYGQSILGNVKEFVGKQSQNDDICLVCLGREK